MLEDRPTIEQTGRWIAKMGTDKAFSVSHEGIWKNTETGLRKPTGTDPFHSCHFFAFSQFPVQIKANA